jgi:hypothetical protein
VNTIIAIIVFIFTPDSVCCFEVLLSLTIQQLVLNKNLYRAMPLRTGVFLWVEIKEQPLVRVHRSPVYSELDLWVLIRRKKAPNNRGFLTDGAQGQSIFSLKAPKESYTAAYKLL